MTDHRLRIKTLGGLSIERNGEVVGGFASRKAEALLVYLACNPRSHPREVLADLLWDDRTQRQAMANLRVVLASLRKQVGHFVDISRESAGVNPQADVTLDATALEASLSAAREQGIVTPEAAGWVDQAVSTYRGEFLQGFYLKEARGFEAWATRERERLQRLVIAALNELVTFETAAGLYSAGITHASRALELDPLQESAHRQMMTMLALSDRRSEALAQYDACRRLLDAELGVPPSPETQELVELIQRGQQPPVPDVGELGRIRPPRTVGDSPYQGLTAFREQDAPFFFGREAFVKHLLKAVQVKPLVTVVVGPSGSGKSSTLHAGLLPRLRAQDAWLFAGFRPGAQPFHALAAALMPLLEPGLGEADRLAEIRKVADLLVAGDGALNHVVARILEKAGRPGRLLLWADQFEELYTLCRDADVQRHFLDTLLEAVRASGDEHRPPLVILVTLRADFMNQALAYRPLADALQDAALLMGPMNRDELRAAIEKPAEMQGAAFDDGLVERILDDVGQEPGNLPLLEFALTLLWERHENGWLTHAGYEAIGRVEGALARYADEVTAELDEGEREQARRIFIQLVQPGEGTEDTRRVATRSELEDGGWSLVQYLADRRLVVTGRDLSGETETVEVVHEALIRNWVQLREWMQEDRRFRTWQERLRVGLRGWTASGRDEGALLRGAPLAEAEQWLAERGQELSPAETEYIQASVASREQRQLVRDRRRRRTLIGLAVGFVVALLLAILSVSQWQRAEGQVDARATAQAEAVAEGRRANDALLEAETQLKLARSRELASLAGDALETDPELAILLALEALSTTYTPEGENLLHQAVLTSRLRHRFDSGDPQASVDATISPDGNYVVGVGGSDFTEGGVRNLFVWSATSGQLLYEVPGPPYTIWLEADLFFDAEIKRLATLGPEKNATLKILDLQSGEELSAVAFPLPIVNVANFALSPDWSQLAIGDADGPASLWSVTTGELLLDLKGHTSRVGVDFSRDGRQLVTVDEEIARVWDVASGQERFSFEHGSRFLASYSPTLSPDSRLLALYDRGEVNIWDLEATADHPAEPVLQSRLTGHSLVGFGISFSADGTKIATGSRDQTARVWNPITGEELLVLANGASNAFNADLNAEGTQLVNGGFDGTVKLWDISPTGSEELFSIPITSTGGTIALSPDDTRLAAAGLNGEAGVWDMASRQLLFSLNGHTDTIERITYSPDGKQIATASRDGTAIIWEATTGEPLLTLGGHGPAVSGIFSGVMGVAYSPDGSRLATVGADGTARIWDARTGDELLVMTYTSGLIRVDFSPDGALLATSSDEPDATAVLWDAGSGEQTVALPESSHGDRVYGLEFSPDGSLLATSGGDGTIKLWRVDAVSGTVDLLATLLGHTGTTFGVRFGRDDQLLASTGTDVLKLWDLAVLPDVNQSNPEATTLTTPRFSIPVEGHDSLFTADGSMLIQIAQFADQRVARAITLDIDTLIALAQDRLTRTFTDEECLLFRIESCALDE